MSADAEPKFIQSANPALPAGCCVIMADVNDLKRTNDTLGHHAGDELIIGAAKCLCRSFTETDRIYRTGGDEFAVIIMDEGYDVDAALNRLQRFSADWKGNLIHGFSISAGAASAKEFDDIKTILKAADQRMYESKRNITRTAVKTDEENNIKADQGRLCGYIPGNCFARKPATYSL